ncbi:MAG: TonB-dependent receptor domain-containing protein, partial [Gemmatimonadaceae bacterium]
PESDLIIALLYTGLQNYGFKGPGLDKVVNQVDGTPLNDYLQWAPGDIMQAGSQNDVQRTIGSFDANWRPLSWMSNQGTLGVDLANIDFFHLCGLNQCPPQNATARVGNVQDNRSDFRNLSAKVVSTSTWNARSWANLKTTIGGDYTNLEQDNVNSNGQTLPPGASTVGAASSVGANETQPTATKTLGIYAQEQGSFRDRLFLTVAARSDQNSAFGTNFQHVLYPKASASWLMSDESFFPHYDWLDQFRLRTSYGASGVQPGRTQGLVQFSPGTVTIDGHSVTSGKDTPALTSNNPGNANLKPEKSAEIEAGFDAQVLQNRVHIEYTYYNKTTHDALISVPFAASAGASVSSLLENVGST